MEVGFVGFDRVWEGKSHWEYCERDSTHPSLVKPSVNRQNQSNLLRERRAKQWQKRVAAHFFLLQDHKQEWEQSAVFFLPPSKESEDNFHLHGWFFPNQLDKICHFSIYLLIVSSVEHNETESDNLSVTPDKSMTCFSGFYSRVGSKKSVKIIRQIEPLFMPLFQPFCCSKRGL